MSEVMPIKIYKNKVEIASELSVPKGNIANGNISNLVSQEGNIANLTVSGTANIGNKILLEVTEDGNAALSIAANNITVGDNITIGSDGNITANSFIGKSISDGNGNNIVETYATKESLNTEVSSVNTALTNYKTEVSNTYALKTEIPSLSGYATETFVNTKLASYVPTSRTINGKALTGNITLGAGDITSGILKVANGGTGTSSQYESISYTLNDSDSVISSAILRYYPFPGITIVNIRFSSINVSSGNTILATLNAHKPQTAFGMAWYSDGSQSSINGCYIDTSGQIHIQTSSSISDKALGLSVAYCN